MDDVVIVSVSYNTRELTALLLWSLHRILEPTDFRVVIVDNASTDGSAELLGQARDGGLCEVIANSSNLGHGPALNVAMNTTYATEAHRVWILDSDCVITRGEALRAPLSASPDAAIIGEAHWDRWRKQSRFGLYSLIVNPAALIEANAPPFTNDGDPAWD
ncbi:MAG: glycosyltransferase family 2 protein, partial [Pseudonocardiaceae bacterium]